jgi:YSIRK-targeted surface antigen transcriptional regulator
MNKTAQFLNLLYNSTFIPVHYYKKDDLVMAFPPNELPIDFITSYKSLLTDTDEHVSYKTTNEFLYIGIIQNFKTGESVIVGPVSNIAITSTTIDVMIKEYSLPIEYKSYIEDFYYKTPLFTNSQFFNILALINRELNHEVIDLTTRLNIFDDQAQKNIGKKHTKELVDRKENERFHNTYIFEKEYYGYIQKGDIEGLKTFFKNTPRINEGKVGGDSLRQAKNIFISSVAIITRKAVEGGLDEETAYLLSDSYIQEAEKMTDPAAITLLNATVAMDFTKRVSEAKIPAGMSLDIYKAIEYISNHVNQDISVEEIADHLKMGRSTLSKKFKRELGFNISAFIIRKKLEEAKSLLHYSDRTISEISEYLCFSSQSYFQNVFKKKYGMTPKEYRKNV